MSDKSEHTMTPKDPEQAAQLNAMISAAVAEAVKSAITAMAVTNKSAQDDLVTALREANKPYISEEQAAKKLREIRESMLWKEDEAENRRIMAKAQEDCPHVDANNRPSIGLIRNYPDRQPRGICVHCNSIIGPREWRIGPPDKENPRGKPYLAPEHRSYGIVRQLVSFA